MTTENDASGLADVLRVIRWRWTLITLVVLPVLVGAIVYAESLAPYYESEAIISVRPRLDRDAPVGADIVRILAPTYVAYITSPEALREVSAATGIEPGTIDDAMEVQLASETSNIAITAQHPSPTTAADIANGLADTAEEFATTDEILDASTIASAVVPTSPAGPPRRLIEAAALLVGLLLGVGAALAVERTRPRIRASEDAAAITGMRVLGEFPTMRGISHGEPVASFVNPQAATAARSLRASLEDELPHGGTLVVTSATGGEGKTTVSGLLSVAIARVGLKTLLIDADARKATLSRSLRDDQPMQEELFSVLLGESDFMSAARPGWVDGLSILPCRRESSSSEIIAREMGGLLQRAREAFDVVVIDAPPLLGTDEGRVLAGMASRALLVVSSGTHADAVGRAMSWLHSAKADVLGLVANRVSSRSLYTYY